MAHRTGTAPACLGLRSQDAFAAASFYDEALQWTTDHGRDCDVSYEQDQVVLRHADEAVAPEQRPRGGAAAKPHLRPRRLVNFRVRDLQAAASADRAPAPGPH
ncbi:hypothetical protein ACFXB3_16275 [Streptomyces sp. NPDC059447]|uniref:hypothetical protein n=1 Tax=unclassified Streptomyces TaxID=2593676 RepID=UPI00367CA10F